MGPPGMMGPGGFFKPLVDGGQSFLHGMNSSMEYISRVSQLFHMNFESFHMTITSCMRLMSNVFMLKHEMWNLVKYFSFFRLFTFVSGKVHRWYRKYVVGDSRSALDMSDAWADSSSSTGWSWIPTLITCAVVYYLGRKLYRHFFPPSEEEEKAGPTIQVQHMQTGQVMEIKAPQLEGLSPQQQQHQMQMFQQHLQQQGLVVVNNPNNPNPNNGGTMMMNNGMTNGFGAGGNSMMMMNQQQQNMYGANGATYNATNNTMANGFGGGMYGAGTGAAVTNQTVASTAATGTSSALAALTPAQQQQLLQAMMNASSTSNTSGPVPTATAASALQPAIANSGARPGSSPPPPGDAQGPSSS